MKMYFYVRLSVRKKSHPEVKVDFFCLSAGDKYIIVAAQRAEDGL